MVPYVCIYILSHSPSHMYMLQYVTINDTTKLIKLPQIVVLSMMGIIFHDAFLQGSLGLYTELP